MQQLQEQLQLNLIQQTHLLQTADKKKNSVPLQQLGVQQHQIIQQLQMTQRQYLFQQGLSLQSHNHSSGNLSNDNVPAWKSEPNESSEPHQNSSVPKSGASLNGMLHIYDYYSHETIFITEKKNYFNEKKKFLGFFGIWGLEDK